MVTRLSGGLTPGDGADPRTFPAIWNVTADTIEAQGTAISGAESDIDALEGKNIPAFGTATPTDGQVLTFDSGASEFVPEDIATTLADLTDTDITSPVSGEVLEYDGTNWVNATAGAGKILQVVSTTKTDTFSASVVAGSYVDITGLSVSITPTSATSKVLVLAQVNGANNQSTQYNLAVALRRDSTLINVGDAAGSRSQVSASSKATISSHQNNVNLSFLDAPTTTSSVTYKVQFVGATGTGTTRTTYLNRDVTDTDSASTGRTASTITVMEVAV